MRAKQKNSSVGFFKQIYYSWHDLKNLLKGDRKEIVSPQEDSSLSAQENYFRQFETKISFTGDIIIKLARYDAYATREEWDAQVKEHRRLVDEYMSSEFMLFNNIHTIFDRLILIFAVIKSAFYGLDVYKTSASKVAEMDWSTFIINALIWLGYYFFRRYKSLIIRKTLQLLKWIFMNKTKYGSRLRTLLD